MLTEEGHFANQCEHLQVSPWSVSSTARKTIRRKKPQASRLKSSHVELGTPAHPETKLEADNTLSRLVEYCDSCQSGDHKSNVDHHFRCPKILPLTRGDTGA
ncbi:hypothetical protein MHU86_21922 [Fragilaria crotonensis]|nr:hypothetical protein MHU86_21922 [Fragilaria crotonensis]